MWKTWFPVLEKTSGKCKTSSCAKALHYRSTKFNRFGHQDILGSWCHDTTGHISGPALPMPPVHRPNIAACPPATGRAIGLAPSPPVHCRATTGPPLAPYTFTHTVHYWSPYIAIAWHHSSAGVDWQTMGQQGVRVSGHQDRGEVVDLWPKGGGQVPALDTKSKSM